MGQVTGNNMGGIRDAFSRAQQARQSQPNAGGGSKWAQQQNPQGLAGMVSRLAQQQKALQAPNAAPPATTQPVRRPQAPTGPLQSAAISDPARPLVKPQAMSLPIKQPPAATTQPVKPQPARNQAYGRMLGAPMRGRGRGRF